MKKQTKQKEEEEVYILYESSDDESSDDEEYEDEEEDRDTWTVTRQGAHCFRVVCPDESVDVVLSRYKIDDDKCAELLSSVLRVRQCFREKYAGEDERQQPDWKVHDDLHIGLTSAWLDEFTIAIYKKPRHKKRTRSDKFDDWKLCKVKSEDLILLLSSMISLKKEQK